MGWTSHQKCAAEHNIPHSQALWKVCRICYGQGRKGVPSNLLSDDIRIVACLDFEGAIVGPHVDGYTDAGDTSFVDLLRSAFVRSIASMYITNHLCRLCTANRKLEVCIFLPVAEEEGKAREEIVVGIASGCDGLWAGIPIQSALLGLGCANEFFPVLELFWILELSQVSV